MFKRVTLTACLLSLTNGAYQEPSVGGKSAARYPAGLDPKSCPNFPVCTNYGVSSVKGFEERRRLQTSSSYQETQTFQPKQPIYQLRYTATPIVQQQKYSQPEYEYVPSSARTQQYNPPAPSKQQYVAAQQDSDRPQYAPPQRYNSRQQYASPQPFTPSQQFAPRQQHAVPQKYAPPQQSVKSSREDQYTPEQRRALDRGEYIGDGDYHGEGLDEAEYHPGQQQSYRTAAATPSVQYDTPAYQKVSAFLAQSQNVRQTPTNDCRNHAYC